MFSFDVIKYLIIYVGTILFVTNKKKCLKKKSVQIAFYKSVLL